MRQEDAVGAAVGDAEFGSDGVRQCVVGADESVRERQPGKRCRVGHVGACRQVVRVLIRPGQRGEDQPDRLRAQRVGVGGGEDRDHRLQRVGQRVDTGVGGQRRRHRRGQARVDDRQVGYQAVVDQGLLVPIHGQHRGRGHLRSGAGSRWNCHHQDPVVVGRELGHPLAGSRNGIVSSSRFISGCS